MKKLIYTLVALLLVGSIVGVTLFNRVGVQATPQYLSINIADNYEVIRDQQLKFANRYNGITSVTTESWGYRYQLSNGDIVEVGNNPSAGFQPMVKTIRWDNSVWFSLGLQSNATFASTLNGLTVSFDFNANIKASIYPVEPSARLPEGGIEYDIQLLKRPAQNTVTFNIDWAGITWTKILPLNVEYTEARCADVFGSQGSPYVLTPTTITGADAVVYKTRPEYEVNSYLGTAVSPTVKPSIEGINVNNGQPIIWNDVSQTYLYIHRGEMTDAVGSKAWVEDINIDQTAKTITFTLPQTWMRNATYPVSQVCGVDPAYTQLMASFTSDALAGGDGVWSDVDTAYNSVVLSMVLSNATAGTENTMGVRANGSSLSLRYVTLHEAEGGGQTHCRMFVQTDANGIFEAYHSDVSDADYFYYTGYWSNTTLTEIETTLLTATTDATWREASETLEASRVYHVHLETLGEAARTVGIRTAGSSLERKIPIHEAEAGGGSFLDMFVKSSASGKVETLSDGQYNRTLGYFGPEMDFVEKWESNQGIDAWADWDITAYLDADGRMADFLLVHTAEAATATMGVRGGDDTTTARTLVEHEAESAGAGGEYTGFSMSAQTNASGVVHVELPATTSWAYLTGYFKPTAAYDLSAISPSSKNYGLVVPSTTYWSIGHTPDNPIDDAHSTFTLTNNGIQCDIDAKSANFTGGGGWTLGGSAGATTATLAIGKSGDNPASPLVLTTSDQELYDALAVSGHFHFDIRLETPTGAFPDGTQRTTTITFTARAET